MKDQNKSHDQIKPNDDGLSQNQRKHNQSQGNISLNKSAKFDEDYKAARKSQKDEYALANSKTGANSDEDEKEAILNGEAAPATAAAAGPSIWA